MSPGSWKLGHICVPSKYPAVDNTVCTAGSTAPNPCVGLLIIGRLVRIILSLINTGSPTLRSSRYSSRMELFRKGCVNGEIAGLLVKIWPSGFVALGSFPSKLYTLPYSSDYIITHIGCRMLRSHSRPTPCRDSRCTFLLRGSAQD